MSASILPEADHSNQKLTAALVHPLSHGESFAIKQAASSVNCCIQSNGRYINQARFSADGANLKSPHYSTNGQRAVIPPALQRSPFYYGLLSHSRKLVMLISALTFEYHVTSQVETDPCSLYDSTPRPASGIVPLPRPPCAERSRAPGVPLPAPRSPVTHRTPPGR